MSSNYLESVRKEFQYYKTLGEKAMAQLAEEQLFRQFNEESNSIAAIVKHLNGNMLSRWTDFLNSDGEKEWRQRDAEFENNLSDREQLMDLWQSGWACLFSALEPLTEVDFGKIVYIRNQGHTVLEAINRQVAHYAYHVGQIVFIAKMVAPCWESLSIPKNKSSEFNTSTFAKGKRIEHFTGKK
jgi:hypothetical protein